MSTDLLGLAIAGRDHAGWYYTMRRSLADLCAAEGWDYPRFCDVLAITSPRVAVKRNLTLARHYMEHGVPHPTTLQSTRRALENWEETGNIRGPKTGAFAEALRGNENAVVIDVWMSRAFGLDHRVVTNRVTLYRECAARIRNISKLLGWTPAETQAAVWAGTLREHGRKVPTWRITNGKA